MGCIFLSRHGIGLGTLLAIDNVKFNLVSLFQRLVTIDLNGGVMNEDIWTVFATYETEAFGVVKPLDCAFVLSHRISPFLFVGTGGVWGSR